MQSALKSLPGVQDVAVDYDAKTATVTCTEDGPSEAEMAAALEAAGFGSN